jgi:hypothetical protein
VFSCVICFRFIHFILISTADALFLTCLPVSMSSGFYLWNINKTIAISVKWNVHFAADWMNKFLNRGRYQIANIISWQNSLHCSQLSTSSVWKLTILIVKS